MCRRLATKCYSKSTRTIIASCLKATRSCYIWSTNATRTAPRDPRLGEMHYDQVIRSQHRQRLLSAVARRAHPRNKLVGEPRHGNHKGRLSLSPCRALAKLGYYARGVHKPAPKRSVRSDMAFDRDGLL